MTRYKYRIMFNAREKRYRIEYKKRAIPFLKDAEMAPFFLTVFGCGIFCLLLGFLQIAFFILGGILAGFITIFGIMIYLLEDWEVYSNGYTIPITFLDPLDANTHIAKLKEQLEVPPNKWVKYIGGIK